MFCPFEEPYQVFFEKKKFFMLGLITSKDPDDEPRPFIANVENGKMQVVDLEEVRICPEEFDLDDDDDDDDGEKWKKGESPV